MAKFYGTYALVNSYDDNTYAVETYSSKGRVKETVVTGYFDRAAVRTAYDGTRQSLHIPLIYGKRLTSEAVGRKPSNTRYWSRLCGVYYRVSVKSRDRKDGDHTDTVAIRRTVSDGYVWLSRKFTNAENLHSCIAQLVRENKSMGSEANKPFPVSDEPPQPKDNRPRHVSRWEKS